MFLDNETVETLSGLYTESGGFGSERFAVFRGSLGGNDGPLLNAGMSRGPMGLLEYPLLEVIDE